MQRRRDGVSKCGWLSNGRRVNEGDTGNGGAVDDGGGVRGERRLARTRGAAVASIFRVDRPVYATPMENIRAGQAATNELDHLEGE